MERLLLAVASFALVPAALAQPRIPAEIAPHPAPAQSTSPQPAAPKGPAASPAAAKEPVPRGAVLEEVSGAVREVDRKAQKMTLDTAAGPVTLALDRNTMVYTVSGLGTVLDIAPGAQVRAGRNADLLAYWVQVRAAPATQARPAPGGGTAPATGAPPPAETPAAGTAASPPGPVPPGPSTPVVQGG